MASRSERNTNQSSCLTTKDPDVDPGDFEASVHCSAVHLQKCDFHGGDLRTKITSQTQGWISDALGFWGESAPRNTVLLEERIALNCHQKFMEANNVLLVGKQNINVKRNKQEEKFDFLNKT